jgi:hormone-sensitive lipase
MFAKKLRKLGVDVSLDVIDGLPHGFLNFTQVDCYFVFACKEIP